MKKTKSFMALIMMLVFIGSYYLFFQSKEVEVYFYTIKKSMYTESIVATGNIKYNNSIELKSEVPGRIKNILASDGEKLEKGEALILLDSMDAELELNELKASLNSIKIKSESIKSEYNKALERLKQSKLNEDSLNEKYERNLTLYNQGAISKETLDDLEKELKLQQSITKIEKENANLYSNDGAKYKEYDFSLEEIRARIDIAEREIEKYTIKAPFDSILLKSGVNEGEYIDRGTTLALIAKNDKKYAEVEINEEKITSIYQGQRTHIYPEGHKSSMIEGVVSYISPTVDEDNGTIKVKILIDGDKDYLVNNLTVKTEFILEEFNDALIIPANYILKEEDKYHVISYHKGKGIKKEVKIYKDMIASDQVKVEEGLEEDDIIINPDDYKKDSKVKLSKGGN